MILLFADVVAAIAMAAAMSAKAPPNPNQRCNIDNTLINATDTAIIREPFTTPDGLFAKGSGTWNWTLATQTSTRDSANISQVLHLKIDPQPDFFRQNSYIGCGVIIHGLTYGRQIAGQASDSGGCENALLGTCVARLRSIAESQAIESGFRTGDQTVPSDACLALSQLKLWRTKGCLNHFNPDVWLEPFLWSGASLNRTDCSFQPGADDASDTAVYSWDFSEYSSSNLTAYNNLTTLIEPIITVLSTSSESTSRWAKANIMCLRTGRNISGGSLPGPSEVPRPSSLGRLLAPALVQVGLTAGMVLLLVSII